MENLPPERYAAWLGEAAAKKYLPKFARFESGGSPLSWNWGACLVTFGWLINRRLGLLALLYLPLSVPAVLFVLGAQKSDPCGYALRGGSGGEGHGVLAGLYLAFVFLVVPAFADYFHWRIVRRRLSVIETTPTPGSPQVRRIVAAFATVALMAFALSPASYDDAASRAKISNAYGLLRADQLVLTEAWQDQGKFPEQPASVLPPADSKAGTIAADASGTLTLTLNFSPVAGRRLVLKPKIDNGQISWGCSSPDLPDACVPQDCRSFR